MDSPMPAELALATFTTEPPKPASGESFTVHFNPESLSYKVSSALRDEGPGGETKQFVGKVDATLSMSLQFDTTTSGEDVRAHTAKVAKLLRPVLENNRQVPPIVVFRWGSYSFRGVAQNHAETIDFFAANGTPLRASVELTLAAQDLSFDDEGSAVGPGANVGARIDTPVFSASASVGVGGAAGLSAQLGDPRAARSIASANGAASLRFGGETGMAVSAGVELRSEAAFSVGASAGLSAGVGAGAGIGFGASAAAGAGGGAFAGLRAGASAGASFSASASIGAGIGVGAGGGGGGPCTDVGVDADLISLIRFA